MCGCEEGQKTVLSEGLYEAHWWQVFLWPTAGGGGVMSPVPGSEISVVHRGNVLLLTQRGHTSFDFPSPYGGIVFSGVVTGRRIAFEGGGLSGIRANRCCRKALVNTLWWWSWISLPTKNWFWVNSWRRIVLLFNDRQSTLMWKVDIQAKLWRALSLLSHVFVISK